MSKKQNIDAAVQLAKKASGASLPIDSASRGNRSKELGFSVDAYHGSPRDIKKFTNEYSNPEGHYGPHHYFTSSEDDVSHNYAGEGPDLTNRIEREMERDDWLADDPGEGVDVRELAKERLGIENQGTVYPVKLRMKNPVRVGGRGETVFNYNLEDDENGNPIESGSAIPLLEKTKEAFDEWQVDEHSAQKALSNIFDHLGDGEISASDYDKAIRSSVSDLYDEMSGDMASPGALIADVFQKMGHDGIDMDASVFSNRRGFGGVKPPGMVGTEDARHYIVFDPKNIRSRFAKFDPEQSESSDILAARGGTISEGTKGANMIDPTRAALVAAHRAAKQGGGASFLGSTFGNIGSMFGAPGPYSSPSAPTYAQPVAAQAPAVPLPPAGAPTSPGANYNAISALLGIPVGPTAGFAAPAYRPQPVYMSDAQRRALMPQPFPVQQPPATGVAPPMGGEGPADEGAPPAPSGPAPFNPNAYDYSGNLRGLNLSGADIGRFLTNAAAINIPVLGMANAASSLSGGPNIGSAIFGARQPAQPLTSIAYDPVFQAAQREAGGYYRDPWGGIYKDGEALTEIPQDFIAQEQAKQSERGAIDTDWGYNPNAAPEQTAPTPAEGGGNWWSEMATGEGPTEGGFNDYSVDGT